MIFHWRDYLSDYNMGNDLSFNVVSVYAATVQLHFINAEGCFCQGDGSDSLSILLLVAGHLFSHLLGCPQTLRIHIREGNESHELCV